MMSTTAAPEGTWRQDIDRLAYAVKPDWLRFDSVWDAFRREHGIHLRRDAAAGNAREFLAEALGTAYNRNLLRRLTALLLKADLVDPEFDELARPLLGALQLQAFQNGVFQPKDALLSARGLLAACDQVCRIDIEQGGVFQHAGTGVLVSPTLVATAAHVVWGLLERVGDDPVLADGSLVASVGSEERLRVVFGDVEDSVLGGAQEPRPSAGEPADLHPDWLAWGSRPTRAELAQIYDVRDISDIEQCGPWDLALIRLWSPRPTRRALLRIDDTPSRPFEVHVIHHPSGGSSDGPPLMWSIGQVDQQLGSPPLRCLHDASTLGGSSGAPVFDQFWKVIALHQGGERVVPHLDAATGLPATGRNRAVPVRHWAPLVEDIERRAAEPYLTQLRLSPDLVPNPYPVVGRRLTQDRIRRALAPGAAAEHRLLIVRGEPGTGRRFTGRLVRELVVSRGGSTVFLDMANATAADAPGFARKLAEACSTQLVEPVADTALTTPQRDVRGTVGPTVGRTVTRVAGERHVWVILEGAGQSGVELPAEVENLILELIGQLTANPALRVVLLGWAAQPPVGFEDAVEELAMLTALDVVRLLIPPEVDPTPLLPIAQGLLDQQLAIGHPNRFLAIHAVITLLAPLVGTLPSAGGRE
jgi:hypothetical protein